MIKPIYLKLDAYEGVVTIPFKSMEDADKFTVMYGDKSILVNALIELLGLSIESELVSHVYLTDNKYKRCFDNDCYRVKYSENNFNFTSLKEAFAAYLKNDRRRILSTDIRYVKTEAILNYFGTGMIDGNDIEIAVRKFFADGTGYKRKRDIYFLIIEDIKYSDIEADKKIEIKIDQVKFEDLPNVDRCDLSVHGTGGDNHLNNLIELYRRKPELRDVIMEEIAQYDIADIKKYLDNESYGIVDGANEPAQLLEREMALLEMTTGLTIDELRINCANFGRKPRSRK